MASDCLSCAHANIDWLISRTDRGREAFRTVSVPLLLGAQDDSALWHPEDRKRLQTACPSLQTCDVGLVRVRLLSAGTVEASGPTRGQAAGIGDERGPAEQVLPRRDDGMLGHHHAASHRQP
jgi:hypothetical protein